MFALRFSTFLCFFIHIWISHLPISIVILFFLYSLDVRLPIVSVIFCKRDGKKHKVERKKIWYKNNGNLLIAIFIIYAMRIFSGGRGRQHFIVQCVHSNLMLRRKRKKKTELNKKKFHKLCPKESEWKKKAFKLIVIIMINND